MSLIPVDFKLLIVEEDEPIARVAEAVFCAQHAIVAVVSRRALVGALDAVDIARAQRTNWNGCARDFMHAVRSIACDLPSLRLIDLLYEWRDAILFVVDPTGWPIGLVTRSQLNRCVADTIGGDRLARPVLDGWLRAGVTKAAGAALTALVGRLWRWLGQLHWWS